MERKQNKALAIVMLCVVILVGAVLWGLLYSYGFLASLIAFATAYVAIVVYDKFYPVSKNVYIISGFAIVVANIIASFLALVIAVAIKADCDLVTAFNALMSVIDDFALELCKDFIYCVVLTILGLVGVKKFYENRKARKQAQVQASQAEVEAQPAESQESPVVATEGETPNENAVETLAEETNKPEQETTNVEDK